MEQKPLNTVHGGLRFRWDPQSHSHKKVMKHYYILSWFNITVKYPYRCSLGLCTDKSTNTKLTSYFQLKIFCIGL